jgi:ssDNA-binding Zn-finger/Zn-ribbon topoisomerase 1
MKNIINYSRKILTRECVCPKCSAKLPLFRIPKSLKQFVLGGRICKKCGHETVHFINLVLPNKREIDGA